MHYSTPLVLFAAIVTGAYQMGVVSAIPAVLHVARMSGHGFEFPPGHPSVPPGLASGPSRPSDYQKYFQGRYGDAIHPGGDASRPGAVVLPNFITNHLGSSAQSSGSLPHGLSSGSPHMPSLRQPQPVRPLTPWAQPQSPHLPHAAPPRAPPMPALAAAPPPAPPPMPALAAAPPPAPPHGQQYTNSESPHTGQQAPAGAAPPAAPARAPNPPYAWGSLQPTDPHYRHPPSR
ncbi:hypothetical protein BC835DRAFT_998777 [Cytidiella melzeri]|nr:hypothetical protein BC835DRAFT_998777 [Cytidiella melzeri]